MSLDSNKVYLTKTGLASLEEELQELTKVKRTEVALRIKSAREMGDISENAEYDSALQEQSFIEGRILELEEILKVATLAEDVIEGTVGVGSKVTVHIDGDEEVFHIVGAPEANPMEGKISHESPLGKALVGKKVGEKFEVEAPVGVLTYTVLNVE